MTRIPITVSETIGHVELGGGSLHPLLAAFEVMTMHHAEGEGNVATYGIEVDGVRHRITLEWDTPAEDLMTPERTTKSKKVKGASPWND